MFNAPAVALAVAASIPALNWLQETVGRADPHLIAALAFQPSDLWRDGGLPGLVTAMFLHDGWAHALMNALAALAFGPPVARLMRGASGAIGFLLFYIACGIVAALGYGLLHPASDDLLVGASGAVFGLVGAALRLVGRRKGGIRGLTDPAFLRPAAVLMLVNVATGLIGFAPGMEGARIAWEAHAVGFVFGALVIGPWRRLFDRPAAAFDSGTDISDPAG